MIGTLSMGLRYNRDSNCRQKPAFQPLHASSGQCRATNLRRLHSLLRRYDAWRIDFVLYLRRGVAKLTAVQCDGQACAANGGPSRRGQNLRGPIFAKRTGYPVVPTVAPEAVHASPALGSLGRLCLGGVWAKPAAKTKAAKATKSGRRMNHLR